MIPPLASGRISTDGQCSCCQCYHRRLAGREVFLGWASGKHVQNTIACNFQWLLQLLPASPIVSAGSNEGESVKLPVLLLATAVVWASNVRAQSIHAVTE